MAGLEWIENLLAAESDLAGLTVHLKIDSGMGRIGFRSASEAAKAQALLKNHGASVEGIFTHFATADEESDTYFRQQLECFKGIIAGLNEVPELVHASNSATTLWHAETIFNAVRMGDSMYGLNPSGQVLDLPYGLKPAITDWQSGNDLLTVCLISCSVTHTSTSLYCFDMNDGCFQS